MYTKTLLTTIAMALVATIALGQTASAYTATIMTDQTVDVTFINGTTVKKPLVQYDFQIGPNKIPYSVTMIGQ